MLVEAESAIDGNCPLDKQRYGTVARASCAEQTDGGSASGPIR
jgi:hypothetical protein